MNTTGPRGEDTQTDAKNGRGDQHRRQHIRRILTILVAGLCVMVGILASIHPTNSQAGRSPAGVTQASASSMDMCAPATGPGGTTAPMLMASEGLQMEMYPTTCTPPTWGEISKVYTLLARARVATDKYRDLNVAIRDGYSLSPAAFVAGQGYHYANLTYLGGGVQGKSFDLLHPPFLVYNKVGGKLRLEGLMYYVPAQTTAQQLASIFPASLASWHRHINLCLSGDGNTILHVYTETECGQQGGNFLPTTGWMVHAWLWRPSSGVFAIDM